MSGMLIMTIKCTYYEEAANNFELRLEGQYHDQCSKKKKLNSEGATCKH